MKKQLLALALAFVFILPVGLSSTQAQTADVPRNQTLIIRCWFQPH